MGRLLALLLAVLAPHAAAAVGLRGGAIRVDVVPEPFALTFTDTASGRVVLMSANDGGGALPSALSVALADTWIDATRVGAMSTSGRNLRATLETTDPLGGTFALRIRPDGEGVIAVEASFEGGSHDAVVAIAAAWRAGADERFYGLGERADAVEHRGAEVESYVSDGPWVEADRALIMGVLPAPGFRARDDATYFPIPWLLSTAGYGLLVDNDETTVHALATANRPDAWSMTVSRGPEGTPLQPAPTTLRFRVFAGPRPANVLRRFTNAVGRQPPPAAPWVFGPWYQGPALQEFRDMDVPVSVSQTYFHYLPCGGDRANEPARSAAAHALGYAITTYFNPMICTSLQPAYDAAASAGALAMRADGTPYVYKYFTNRFFDVSQFDFSAAVGRRHYGALLQQAVDDGYDGWMEDFGEYTPLDVHTADGRDGAATHNHYPTDYHCGAYDFSRSVKRPLVRFQRSGWTGAARCAQVVWSGDPTTAWDFDGLRSVVTTGLGMGLSGVARWGSDIGGFFSLFGGHLTDELLLRWVQLGAFSGVMRTERDGTAIPAYDRPQVEDPAQIANWRRYTKLRTQLYPYLLGADREYRRSGLPIMRHLVLTNPDDPAAVARDDEYLFGPDLLVAPVLVPGATSRDVYLPADDWIEFWRAVAFRSADGAFVLGGATVVAGGAVRSVAAPLDELPLFVRAGAILALLSSDVDTLADYGAGSPGLVRLADRADVLHLIAFPRGDSSGKFLDRGKYRSLATSDRWRLSARAERRTTWTIEVSLATLETPFTPCAVLGNGRPLPDDAWSFDAATGVLRATVVGRGIRLEARATCP